MLATVEVVCKGMAAPSSFSAEAEIMSFVMHRAGGHDAFRPRLRTVVSSERACIPSHIPGRESIIKELKRQANALGTLRHLVSIYLNVLADEIQQPDTHKLISERWFVSQLFRRLLRLKLRRDAAKKLDLYPQVREHLESYVITHIDPIAAQLTFCHQFLSRPRDALAGEMITAMKQHVSSGFTSRVEKLIAYDAALRLQEHEQTNGFKKLLKKAGKVIFEAAIAVDSAQALLLVEKFCTDNPVIPLLNAAKSSLAFFREAVAPLRVDPFETDKTDSRNQSKTFFPFYCKARPDILLLILSKLRLEFRNVLKKKAEGHLNTTQLEKKEAQSKNNPVMELAPKPFTLLPFFSLKPAAVAYDNASLYSLVRLAMPKAKHIKPLTRVWWSSVFDFHGSNLVHKATKVEVQQNAQKRKRQEKTLKCRKKRKKRSEQKRLKRHRKKRLKKCRKLLRQSRQTSGIPMLGQSKWTITDTDADYERKKQNASVRIPWLVNSLRTDGLRVFVTIVSAGRGRGLAIGVDELKQRGYSCISDTLDPDAHSTGLFADIRSPVDTPSLLCVGVDPGQVHIVSTVRAEASFSASKEETAKKFRDKDIHVSSRFFSDKQYRFENLSAFFEKEESKRRVDVPAYGAAIERLSNCSLKLPGKCAEYAKVKHETLDVMMVELLSDKRRVQRFTAYRAKQRSAHHMASFIAYGAENEVLRASKKRGRKKRELKKALYGKKRVVFWGKAQFGHGSRGPCPRKLLLRSLSLLCPVVLTDEHRTSKCCHGCGAEMEQTKGSRVFRCPTSQTGANPCSVGSVNRDTNGAANIATCGLRRLLGLPRPDFLTRTAPATAQ